MLRNPALPGATCRAEIVEEHVAAKGVAAFANHVVDTAIHGASELLWTRLLVSAADARHLETVRNLKSIAPTYHNMVPAGWALLADELEKDEALARTFFAKVTALGRQKDLDFALDLGGSRAQMRVGKDVARVREHATILLVLPALYKPVRSIHPSRT